jgi:endonuclease YncB( thermonuclease family)
MAMSTALLTKDETRMNSYSNLRREVQRVLFEGRKKLEALRVSIYWQASILMNRHLKHYRGESGYGKKMAQNLAHDLEMDASLLYRILKFAPSFRNLAPRPNLTWTHYRELLGVKDEGERKRLTASAVKETWTHPILVQEIKKSRGLISAVFHTESLLEEPERETGRAFQIRVYRNHLAGGEIKVLDLGFQVYSFFGARKLNRFQAGSIVRWNDDTQKFDAESRKSRLYTYKGIVERVVDGDTLRVQVDLGFGSMAREYLRFAHINAAEIKTKPGLRARAFVKRTLGQTIEVEFRSHGRDRYGRYVSDVWVRDLYLSNVLLKEGLAKRV